MYVNTQNVDQIVTEIQHRFKIIGRTKELHQMVLAVKARKHVLIEGEVGVGKTRIAKALAEYMGTTFFRVDGSEDLLSYILVGYFDPPGVIAKGYIEDTFIYGPLARSMLEGGCLFINELNRIPESSQNILLTAFDEGIVEVAKLKTIKAKDSFFVVATQNPEAHVGVTALGEALKDRFVWVHLDYQPAEEEELIVIQEADLSGKRQREIAHLAVRIARGTRNHQDIRRGASVRAAIDIAALVKSNGPVQPEDTESIWMEVAIMALSTKIELMDSVTDSRENIIKEIVLNALQNTPFA
ncbi:MAG: ATPase [Promethearchaeota archaeon CR_4]|nr:MAG: ATPase [Candidatus Lokiarchaeota archaeon CR_4]